jgi:hypothetical protein
MQSMSPPSTFLMAVSVFMKFCVNITALEQISTAYFLNLSLSVCVYTCISLVLLGNGSVNISLSLTCNGSVKQITVETDTHTTIEELLDWKIND